MLDANYIDTPQADELAALDINDPGDQDLIIEKAFLPEYRDCNDISKRALRRLLIESESFPEAHVRDAYEQCSLFTADLKDVRALLRRLRQRLDELEGSPLG